MADGQIRPKKRRHISLEKQLHAALIQLGLDPRTAELHHAPALGLRRVIDLTTGELDPPHDSPEHLVWLGKEVHAAQTTGRRGESKLSKRGGDISEIAKLKRIEDHTEDFRRRMLWKCSEPQFIAEVGEGVSAPIGAKLKRSWPSRPFPKQLKKSKPDRHLRDV